MDGMREKVAWRRWPGMYGKGAMEGRQGMDRQDDESTCR
jgi:hypothetical protein